MQASTSVHPRPPRARLDVKKPQPGDARGVAREGFAGAGSTTGGASNLRVPTVGG